MGSEILHMAKQPVLAQLNLLTKDRLVGAFPCPENCTAASGQQLANASSSLGKFKKKADTHEGLFGNEGKHADFHLRPACHEATQLEFPPKGEPIAWGLLSREAG